MLGNPDIWREIFSHLEIDYSIGPTNHELTNDEIINRRTIFHVSLLSSDYVELGLDALWKNMKTLEPIAKILTWNATPEEECLRRSYDEEINLGWILHRPIKPDRIDLAKRYLSRIKCFQLKTLKNTNFNDMVSLCHVLSGILANGTYLLPNLTKVYLNLDENCSSCWNYIPSIFMSPALKHVIYSGSSEALPLFATHHLNLCTLHPVVDLTSITYCGTEDVPVRVEDFIHGLTYFKNLQNLVIVGGWFDLQYNHTAGSLLSLRLHSLTSLTLDLEKQGLFFTCVKAPSRVFAFPKLQELRIKGGHVGIREFLNRFTTCRTLNLCNIEITGRGKQPPYFLRMVSSIFPLLKSLAIKYPMGWNPLISKDFSSFLNLTTFSISPKCHYSFTNSGLAEFITIWPNLETFEIYDNGHLTSNFFPPDILINFSTLPHLYRLSLPLDFINLATSITKTKGDDVEMKRNNMGSCPLQIFTISDFVEPPEKLQEKIVFVNYLLRLFPLIHSIKTNLNDKKLLHVANDLQDLVSFRRVYL